MKTGILIFSCLLQLHLGDLKKLNDYVGHYEELHYDTESLHHNHHRARRSTSNPFVHLDFTSHDREFHLRLKRDTSIFDSDAKMEVDGMEQDLDSSHIYTGQLLGEQDSKVHGSIIAGIFSGTITIRQDTYYIDKSELYFTEPQPFHSIIYHEHEVMDASERKKAHDIHDLPCAMEDPKVKDWMNNVQQSASESSDTNQMKYERLKRNAVPRSENIYSRWTQTKHRQERYRRATSTLKRTCTLYLQSDIMLWKYMTDSTERAKGLGYAKGRAMEEITSLFASHVSGIKNIYENTSFKYEDIGPYVGFTFAVRRVKINTTMDCEGAALATNVFCKRNIDVSNFLNLNSLTNHNLYCLAYVFTYRDFTGGTLGLAWVGSPTKASGGICEKWKEYTESGHKVYKSLNTGIVTLVNYGSRVPPKVSTLTFAHEVGHNFGSPHDSGADCVPTDINPNNPDGNFIMFASATSGDRNNNNRFSRCSIGNITLVLYAVINNENGKDNCFEDRTDAFCGNAIVEGNEVCDCGFENDCNKTENCCYPRMETSDTTSTQCTLKSTAECSPSQGPCCSTSCVKVSGNICQIQTECSQQSVCNGTTAHCPTPDPEADLTPCNDNTQVCTKGSCGGTICQRIGWDQCYLTAPAEDKHFDKGKLCYVACKQADGDCISSGDLEALALPDNQKFKDMLIELNQHEGLRLAPGAPCDNFKGYCDVFQKCRGVDADGPLARLKNLFLNKETLNTIRDWIIRYWWGVLLIGVALVVFMGVFIKVCAVHTPSSNPKKKPARKISLRPQPNRARQPGPPPGYSGQNRGGPPHGRGRLASDRPASDRPPPYNAHAHSYELKPQGQRV